MPGRAGGAVQAVWAGDIGDRRCQGGSPRVREAEV